VITHRKSVDLIRRNDRHRRQEHQDVDTVSQAGPVEQSSLQAGIRSQIREILTELPPIQRQLIELAYFGGYTQSELAVRLSLPIGTVKSRTHAALTALRGAAQKSGLTIQDVL
jgi:RNA polymerase sigma-70 factor (ECF subfamily)